MRPGSGRMGMPGTSSGAPPGTGIRPGSGRVRLSTGQTGLRGPGTQAAQGVALNATVNVADRPMTGQGVMGMKTSAGRPEGGGRLVEDHSHFVGLLRKKMRDITQETTRLRTEMDEQNKNNSQTAQLERKYETLLKNKEALEGQLADYNLAMDKTRTSTDPEDVQALAMHMSEKNRQTGQELDRVFMQRKQRENDIGQIEEQIEGQFKQIQARINELEPAKLKSYNELHEKQRELQDRCVQTDHRLGEINNRIRQYESDDKSSSMRKDFTNLERRYQSLRRDAESLEQELDIANMDPKEAHTQFVNRVNSFKAKTKELSDKVGALREENNLSRRSLDEMDNQPEEDNGDAAKYELLVKRDQEMTAFMDKFEDTRGGVLVEQKTVQDMIVKLLDSISRGIEDSANMPSQEVMTEMENTKTFKEKNMATAQKTMESLQMEKKKREKELALLHDSEPKLNKELENLGTNMKRMENEMKQFADVNGLREAFEVTKLHLLDLRSSYTKRRDGMRQQVQAASVEHEAIKRALSSNETARELDDTEKRLKHYERSIFEIREFVESKSRETDFEQVKMACLKITENLNVIAIRKAKEQPSPFVQQQAKW
jgi:intraflagellar transport protein 74